MKKYLLGLFVMFFCLLTVSASTGGSNTKIELEDISLKSTNSVAYNGVLEVNYDLNPRDTNNKTLTWKVTGLKKGISATIVDGNKTNVSTGTLKINFKNDTKEVVKVTITATNNKISKSIEVLVQNEEKTNELNEKAKEIEDLIKTLPEEITRDNYSEVEEILNKIDSLFNDNEDVEDFVSQDLTQKYEFMLDEFENYKESSLTTGTIITIVILALSFIFGLFVIFKKEEK